MRCLVTGHLVILEIPTAGYFKKEAIQWSWELLHDKFGIPLDKIYATVFEGDKEQNIPIDQKPLMNGYNICPRKEFF